MSRPEFTVLVPVHRSPELLRYSLDSVLAQERQDFEVSIVCDGAPEATVEFARAAAKRDARIRAHVHPKGERCGEAWRHQALEGAQGRYVCHLADDDLWFPNHLSEMGQLLEQVEFGNVQQVLVLPNKQIYAELGDLGLKESHELMLGAYNFFGFTQAGYRLETYRRLPVGWSPAPPDLWTDLHMWRKFLALPGIRTGTRIAITSLQFPALHRRDWTLERRIEEMKYWVGFLADPRRRDRISQGVLSNLMRGELTRRAMMENAAKATG